MTSTDYQKQAEDFLDKTGTIFKAKFLYRGPFFDKADVMRDIYEITLKRGTRTYSFRFGQSINASIKKQKPTTYDVLACLTKSDPGTFKDFSADFGYDEDSRKAFDIYLKVQEEWASVQRMFGDVLDELREIN